MIARQENFDTKSEVWSALAAPVSPNAISWRQDGKPVMRDGRHFARFVCYVEANTVRERLDSVVPGEWDLTLELLPQLPGEDSEAPCAFKARLQVLGVIREDVGTGRDYKSASTDAFKRAAVRFGIAHELYAYEQNWVEVDGDGRYAKPVEDPAAAYERRHGNGGAGGSGANGASKGTTTAVATDFGAGNGTHNIVTDVDAVSCPKCGGRMWDNRLTKRNPKAPDYKCRDRSCDGVVWPPRPMGNGSINDETEAEAQVATPVATPAEEKKPAKRARAAAVTTDDIPF